MVSGVAIRIGLIGSERSARKLDNYTEENKASVGILFIRRMRCR
jgi:hypothetical protein